MFVLDKLSKSVTTEPILKFTSPVECCRNEIGSQSREVHVSSATARRKASLHIKMNYERCWNAKTSGPICVIYKQNYDIKPVWWRRLEAMNHHTSVFRNGAVNINVKQFDKGQNSIRIPTNQSINQSVDIRNYDKNWYIICIFILYFIFIKTVPYDLFTQVIFSILILVYCVLRGPIFVLFCLFDAAWNGYYACTKLSI